MPYTTLPSGGVTGVVQVSGVTTIIWGTEGIYNSFVVLAYRPRQLVTNTKLPNGSGATVTRVQVIDGITVDLTVRDDTTMTPPKVGTQITLIDRANLLGNGNTGNFTGRVVESGGEYAPAKDGERQITVEKLTLVD